MGTIVYTYLTIYDKGHLLIFGVHIEIYDTDILRS